MCTVTFFPKENGDFILTSSRDEQVDRKTLSPKFYLKDGVKQWYPKDKKAGGTWIAVSETERAICMVNGAYEKHKQTGDYKYSRGLVVKDILRADQMKCAIESLDLEGIEPFTMIALDWSFLPICMELVWDGTKKQLNILSNQSKIWSSSTLYDTAMKKEREMWFANFKEEHPFPAQQKILDFHSNDSLGTKESAIRMKRSDIETVSITSIVKTEEKVTMLYKDLLTGEQSSMAF
jgi:hypothetical protein